MKTAARDRLPPPNAEQRAAIALNQLRYARGEAYREGRLAEFDRVHGIKRRAPEPPREAPKKYVPPEVAERGARRAAAAEPLQAWMARLDIMIVRAGFAPADAIKPLVKVGDDPLDAALCHYQPELQDAAE